MNAISVYFKNISRTLTRLPLSGVSLFLPLGKSQLGLPNNLHLLSKEFMQELLKELRQTKIATLKYFDLPESEMQKTYAIGKWTIRELLNHIADAETVLYDRVRRVISSDDRPVIWAFDQDAWNAGLNYTTFPLRINKSIYMATRTAVEYLVKEHYEKIGGKEFIHSETGLRTLKDEFDKFAWHNQHHLNQIEMALKSGLRMYKSR